MHAPRRAASTRLKRGYKATFVHIKNSTLDSFWPSVAHESAPKRARVGPSVADASRLDGTKPHRPLRLQNVSTRRPAPDRRDQRGRLEPDYGRGEGAGGRRGVRPDASGVGKGPGRA